MKTIKRGTKKGLIRAIIAMLLISIFVVAVSAYFLEKELEMGIAFLVVGIISLSFLGFFDIRVSAVYPDVIFGFIDNSVLVFAAIVGGAYAGVAGAIIGGAAGNTITDGVGGLFEGYIAEHQRKLKIDNMRTSASSSIGKMAGCLFGAGVGLLIVWGWKTLV